MTGSNPQDTNQDDDIGHCQGITKEQWQEVKEWWLNQILPDFRDWDAVRIEEGAGYLRANKIGALELIRSKLQADKRLAVVGMVQHPNVDNLPLEIIKYANVDFIAVEARNPEDKIGGFKEDKEGLTTIDLGGGMLVDMPHEQAKKMHPDKYKNPDAPSDAYNTVIAVAENSGIHVLYAVKGATWKEMNMLSTEEIAGYMQKNPDARGVYFSSIYSALKWPGYSSKEEQEELGFGRPLASDHIFSTNPRNDTSVRMPAFSLEQLFPGQIYSVSQFIMPRGYGQEWKNLRLAVEASGIQKRFSIDNIASTPFAVQRYLFRGLVELSEIPDEELWKYFGTMAQGFFGPAEVRWDKVLDGVIIYPSDEQLPSPPTMEQMMEESAKYIAKAIGNFT